MSKFTTSFSFGFATAAVFGAALLLVLRPAQATEPSLGDWARMSADAKLVHARHVAADRSEGGMEYVREILFCLHDQATHDARRGASLSEAVRTCQEKLRATGA